MALPAAAKPWSISGLISKVLALGKTALVLVPEIALTPQLMETFMRHFGDQVAVLHSALQTGQRYDEWKRIRAARPRWWWAHVLRCLRRFKTSA